MLRIERIAALEGADVGELLFWQRFEVTSEHVVVMFNSDDGEPEGCRAETVVVSYTVTTTRTTIDFV